MNASDLKDGVKHPVASVQKMFAEIHDHTDLGRLTPLRCWAAKNAFTLIFLSIMFGITWVLILVGVFH